MCDAAFLTCVCSVTDLLITPTYLHHFVVRCAYVFSCGRVCVDGICVMCCKGDSVHASLIIDTIKSQYICFALLLRGRQSAGGQSAGGVTG